MATAIITGGSSGLGLEFSRALASRGYNLVIIARGEEALANVCRELSTKYHIKARGISADLSDARVADQIVNLIDHTRDLAYFINNAGFAVHLDMTDDSLSARRAHESAARVMGVNVVLFSTAAAKVMKRQGYGHIINVASTASLTFQGHYSALKSYVVTFTESMALNLRGSGVTATAVCPSWMKTNFHREAGLGEPNIPSWLYMQPSKVAKVALKGADNGKSVVVPTALWKVIYWWLDHGPIACRRRFTTWYLNSGNYRKKGRR